ncbi:MAG: hypothetical protein M1828_001993, partial [Chrysothrix sp. TS-e1954]
MSLSLTNLATLLPLILPLLLIPPLIYTTTRKPPSPQPRSIPSPRSTLLPHLTPSQSSQLAYPPNAMPGARDVDTPYGTMRIYEWGDPGGRRVVFVHGDATPAPLFAGIAHGLVRRGCRVLLFEDVQHVTFRSIPNMTPARESKDLWGRGYTDTPLNARHDSRLFATQILFAIASSPVAWTGRVDKFSIIGFSLGGCIALDFAGTFPSLVEGLVLLGPAGMIRRLPRSYTRFFIRHPPPGGLLRGYLRGLIGELLGVRVGRMRRRLGDSRGVLDAGAQHVGADTTTASAEMDISGLLQWQYDYHEGHVDSFVDTINHGPVMGQHAIWKKACDVVRGEACPSSGLHNSKILVFLGDADDVVIAEETSRDLLSFLPDRHVVFKLLPGGHGFVYPNSEEITSTIAQFWEM